MDDRLTLFEVSWEVGNKVGGIHTVIATKARTLVSRLGDRYVCVGPWQLGESRRAPVFEDDKGFEGFAESCRAIGVPVRVGRWQVPGRPRTVLVDASGLNQRKDDILKGLWDRFRVDSLFGEWDYVEPLLFGHAAGRVIERWWQEFVAPRRGEAVAQFHEWMTGSGILHLKDRVPGVGTVFTTHATVLGRALGHAGQTVDAGLAGRTPDQAAEALGVRSKHSVEAACAREADVLTTVSAVTADEVDFVLRRRAKPVLINGIDLVAEDELAGGVAPEQASSALRRLAGRFLGEEVPHAAFVATTGRYEMRNKGFDLFVDALRLLDGRPGRQVVAFLFVPSGQSGVRHEVLDRLRGDGPASGGPIGICTHNLFDPENDPIARACAAAGLENRPGSRVKVIQVAGYLSAADGLLDLPYEAVMRGLDLACFPSAYEPWGYTPVESLAAGAPTVTSDLAGFGAWAKDAGLGPADGVTVIARRHRPDAEATEDLAAAIEAAVAPEAARPSADACRAAAGRLDWDRVLVHYEAAFRLALDRAAERALGPARAFAAKPPEAPPDGGPHFVDFEVAAALPEPLRGLERVARNLWWCWDPDGPWVFADLAPEAWKASRHNPVAMLADVPASDLSEEAADAGFAARVRGLVGRFDAYMAGAARIPPRDPAALPADAKWPEVLQPEPGEEVPSPERPIAYFSAEFGVHESLPVYNGGLGVLAGDHLKAASDLAIPLVAVGLFYRKGYLRQRVSARGDQVPLPVENEPRSLPMDLVRDATGRPLTVVLDLPGTRVHLAAWRVMVGRIPLYLLDADLPENRPEDRSLTHQLYGGDQEHRLRQEIALGKGGMRLIARLGLEPSVVHMNEGHAAFASLERASRLFHRCGLSFAEAAEVVRSTTVFTTHTPVPAGHDRFPESLVRRYFSHCDTWLGLPWERFWALGTAPSEREFNMTYLGLRMSAVHNAVSRLHGQVSRRLLQPCWPGLLEEEVPVGFVTNGVHLPTWTGRPVRDLLVAGEGRAVTGADFLGAAPRLDDAALWKARGRARLRLLEVLRDWVRRSCAERHDPASVVDAMLAGLSGDAMLLGFARRFASYKRADLLLRDRQRLEALVGRADRPVRLFFAGKAHPHDGMGQDLLRKVVDASRSPELIGRVYFLEDYDMELARRLVQGVDAWLNTPVRGLEASGTSGMKAVANGAVHVSVRDGWWDEGFEGDNGWAIGDRGLTASREVEDDLDAAALYRLLEDEVLPAFFDRDAAGLPRRWLSRVKKSLETLPPVFDARRMVLEYGQTAYWPLASAGLQLSAEGYAQARATAARHASVRRAFPHVRILSFRIDGLEGLVAGGRVEVFAEVDLDGLDPAAVVVELVFRAESGGGHVAAVLEAGEAGSGSVRAYRGGTVVRETGRLAGAVRVRARADRPEDAALRDLVVWA